MRADTNKTSTGQTGHGTCSEREEWDNMNADDIDSLIQAILVDAYGEDEQLWAFRQVFEDEIEVPLDGFALGEPISVRQIDYDGNSRRGLTSTCRKANGDKHTLSLSDVNFQPGTKAALYLVAYRKWLGIETPPSGPAQSSSKPKRHRVEEGDIDVTKPLDLVVLSVKENAIRCRLPGTRREITVRASGLGKLFPGAVVSLQPARQWRFNGHP